MQRKPFVGGNWKCNGSLKKIDALLKQLNSSPIPMDVDVVIAPTALHMLYAKQRAKEGLQVAAQNCSATKQGPYTGELSADMIADAGVQWVILGHSERRALYGESDDIVAQKITMAQKQKLKVIACIGETLEERKNSVTKGVLFRQLEAIGHAVTDWSGVVVAYEPVWAIGTGVVASPEQAQEVHGWLRAFLAQKFGSTIAANTRIIYGGSVSGENCEELIKKPDIDGFLVGGASLKPEFSKIFTCLSSQLTSSPKAKL